MYGYLLRFLPPFAAKAVCALWFAALVAGTVVCSFEPAADFNYGRY